MLYDKNMNLNEIMAIVTVFGLFSICWLWVDILLPTPKRLPKIVQSKSSMGREMILIVGILGIIIGIICLIFKYFGL